MCIFFFKQKTAYELLISDWSSDVCSSDLLRARGLLQLPLADGAHAALRDRTLRPLLAGRRVGVRPPAPVGLQAHRAGPGARGRPLFRRLAPGAPDRKSVV